MHFEAAVEALATALEHAEAVGDRRAVQELWPWQIAADLVWGPMPASEAARRAETLLEDVHMRPYDRLHIGVVLAYIYFMLGRFDEARALWRRAETMIAELGLQRESAMYSGVIGSAETWTGDTRTAERLLRHSYATTDEGARWTVATDLAELLLDTGREDEAAALMREAEQVAVESDLEVEICRRCIQARLLALQGRFADGERLAREATAIAAGIDELNDRARADWALGEVLARAVERRGRLESGAAISRPASAS